MQFLLCSASSRSNWTVLSEVQPTAEAEEDGSYVPGVAGTLTYIIRCSNPPDGSKGPITLVAAIWF